MVIPLDTYGLFSKHLVEIQGFDNEIGPFQTSLESFCILCNAGVSNISHPGFLCIFCERKKDHYVIKCKAIATTAIVESFHRSKQGPSSIEERRTRHRIYSPIRRGPRTGDESGSYWERDH